MLSGEGYEAGVWSRPGRAGALGGPQRIGPGRGRAQHRLRRMGTELKGVVPILVFALSLSSRKKCSLLRPRASLLTFCVIDFSFAAKYLVTSFYLNGGTSTMD